MCKLIMPNSFERCNGKFEEMKGLNKLFDRLFSTINIGTLQLANRLIVAPMVTCFATEDGYINDRYLAYMEEKSRGGWAMITTEAQAVMESGKCFDNFFGLYKDECLPGQRKLVETVHKNGCKICVQLNHGGRQTLYSGAPPVAPSPIADPTSSFTPAELTKEQILEIIECFGDAALRAKKAGYDAVEIQGAHGYLVQEFTSPYSNKRTDEYGGTLEGRAKFSLDIIRKIKEKCGQDFPLIFRMSSDEYLPHAEGLKITDSMALAVMYEEAGVDALHSSIGNYTTIQYMLPPSAVKRGESGDLASELKKVVNIPVINVGRYNDPYVAEAALRAGRCDLVAMARQSLADPLFPQKVRSGALADIRRCIGCQIGCVENLYKGVPINCTMNPRIGHEYDYKQLQASGQSKQVMVIGGGVGGMMSAIAAAENGHEVCLYEKNDRLGGQWNLACIPPYKQELASLVNWQKQYLEKLKVKVELNKEVTAAMMAEENPTEIIVATGSRPIIPPIKGIEGAHVLTAAQVLSGQKIVGQRTAVIGGGDVGCETAAFIASTGKEAAVFEMMDTACPKMEGSVKFFLQQYLDKHSVAIHLGAQVLEIREHSVLYKQNGEVCEYGPVDNIVIALGGRANSALADQAQPAATVHVIGDAAGARRGINAMQEGYKVGKEI